MVTIIDSPEKLNFSQNELFFKVETDKLQPCTRAVFVLNELLINTPLTITIEGISVELPAYSTIAPFDTDLILFHYSKNFLLSEYFDISISGSDYSSILIRFDACDCGILDISVVPTNAQEIELPTFDGGSDDVLPENFEFKARLQCFDEDTGKWDAIGEFCFLSEDNGCGKLYVQNQIDACLSCSLPANSPNLRKRNDSIKKFRISFWDKCQDENGDLQQSNPITSDFFWAMKGGFDSKNKQIGDILADDRLNILDYWQDTEVIETTHFKPEFVSFVYCADRNVSIFTRAIYKNRKDVVISSSTTPQTDLLSGDVCIFDAPVGLCQTNNLGDKSQIFKICFEIIVVNQSTSTIAFEREYEVVEYENCDNYFAFCNGLGGIQSVCIKGERAQKIKTKSKNAENVNCETIVYKKEISDEIDIRSKILNIPKTAWQFEELICGNDAHEFIKIDGDGDCLNCENMEICPIVIDNTSFLRANNKNHESRFRLKFKRKKRQIAPSR